MQAVTYIVQYLVFPGFVFSAVVGLMTTWVDRKVSARVQLRVGPPWYQPFADTAKLLGKEVVVPSNARWTGFLVMPVIGLAAATLASTILWLVNLRPESSFVGDTIVTLYIMTIPAIALIIGGSASGNPLGALGSAREMKLLFAYELPLAIAFLTTIVKVGSFSFEKVLVYQQYNGVMLGSVSGVLAFIVAIFCAQAKLGFLPFDIPEAETEIVAGSFTEYSGLLLGLFRMTVDVEMVVGASLLAAIFFPFWSANVLLAVLLYLVKVSIIVLLLSYLRTIVARLRIDQLVNFCWRYAAPVGFLQILLTIIVKGTVLS